MIGFDLELEEAVGYGDRTIALAQTLNEPLIESIAHFFNAGQYWVGRLDQAEKHSEALRALTERLRTPYGISNAAYMQCQLAAARGDWDAAKRALEWGFETGSPDSRLLAYAARIAFVLGDVEVARGYQQRLTDFVANIPPGPSLDYVELGSDSRPRRAAQPARFRS